MSKRVLYENLRTGEMFSSEERDPGPNDYPSKKIGDLDRVECGKVIHALTIALKRAKKEGDKKAQAFCREQISIVFKRQDEALALEEARNTPENEE